jgi:hypothetical protein
VAACASHQAPREPTSGAPAARITCDGTSTVVETPVVEATSAGVVFEVEVPKGSQLGFTVREAGRGDNAEAGPFVWVVPPGRAHVACLSDGQDPGNGAIYEPMPVIDPHPNYRDAELACAKAHGIGMSEGPALPKQPEDHALDLLDGLRPDDVVERAAYLESSEEATVRVVRDGAVVATVEFENLGEGLGQGWTFVSLTHCAGAGISL